MKKPKIMKHTGIFQSMMENYKKSTNPILASKRLSNSLNSYLLKDLYNIKNKDNFSDAEYFINEIRFENKLKGELAEKKQNDNKEPKISNKNNYTNKITKDLFFYYKYQINGKDKNKKNIKDFRINERIKSPKSIHSISSAKKSYLSYKQLNDLNLNLPLIYSKNYLTPYKRNCKTIANENDYINNIQTENNKRINFSGRNKKPNYLNYEQNYFNNINEDFLLKNKQQFPRNIFLRIKLPLISNKIFKKVDEVTGISKSISRNINNLSDEKSKTIENEKNRIKFMDNLMS